MSAVELKMITSFGENITHTYMPVYDIFCTHYYVNQSSIGISLSRILTDTYLHVSNWICVCESFRANLSITWNDLVTQRASINCRDKLILCPTVSIVIEYWPIDSTSRQIQLISVHFTHPLPPTQGSMSYRGADIRGPVQYGISLWNAS